MLTFIKAVRRVPRICERRWNHRAAIASFADGAVLERAGFNRCPATRIRDRGYSAPGQPPEHALRVARLDARAQ